MLSTREEQRESVMNALAAWRLYSDLTPLDGGIILGGEEFIRIIRLTLQQAQ